MSSADLRGARLRAVRLDRGLTQIELAYVSGHSLATVSKCERGQTEGRMHAIGVLADLTSALDIDLDLLMSEV